MRFRTSWVGAWLVAATCLLAIAPFLTSQPGFAAHVTPTVVSSTAASCGAVAPGTDTFTILGPLADGSDDDGTLFVTIDVRDDAGTEVFDFTANIGVDAVIVMAASDGNAYIFNPEETADTDLRSTGTAIASFSF